MALLDFSGVGFGYSDERVIVEASGTLHPGNIIGLVGANGGGKTTLLKLIVGTLSPEDGTCQMARNTNLAYVSQSSPFSATATLHEHVRSGRADLVKLSKQVSEVQHGLTEHPDDPPLLARLSKLEEQFNALDGHMWEHNVLRLLSGIGFRDEQHSQLLGELSGGQQQKANLARALINGANCYIFDEPTNHLDLAAQAFFVSYLKQLPRETGIILVSHDRWLLDALCTHIWELDTGVLYRYPGNYTRHIPAREMRRKQARLAFERQQEQIAKTEDYIRRNLAGQNTRQAQGRRTLLGRMERMERPGEDPQMSFVLTPRLRTGEQLLLAENLSFAYGMTASDHSTEDTPPTNVAAGPIGLNLNPPLTVERSTAKGDMLFRDVTFSIYRGELLGIVGPNGCGKTTILKLLAKQFKPVQGMVAWGSNAELGVFSQDSSDLMLSNNLLQELRRVAPNITDGAARSYLGRFGFSGDDVYADCESLSGGERNRLSLAKIFYQRPNVLLLDEPTNHLDIYAREALEEFLLAYQGSVIMVTHDRALLERLSNRLLIFDPWDNQAAVTFYRGGYTDYVAWKERTAVEASPRSRNTATGNFPLPDPAAPDLLSAEDIVILAEQARTSPAAYCAKQGERLASKQEELEELISTHETEISQVRERQTQADEQSNYEELTALQTEIDQLQIVIDSLLTQLTDLAHAEEVWLHLRDSVAIS